MFEHLTIRWIVGLLAVGLVIYGIVLLIDENGSLVLVPKPKHVYVEARVDSSYLDTATTKDLYRHEQAAVTIDTEEHKERVFFTGEDIKAYKDGISLTIRQIKNK